MAGVLVAACSSTAAPPSGSWPYPNADIANTRNAPDSTISSANVSTLKEAWAFKLTGATGSKPAQFGSLAATPIVENGVVYIQDLHSNVYALSLATGMLIWKYTLNAPTLGPNGVAVVDGRVYGDSPTSAFSLSAATGRKIWAINLQNENAGTFGIQPQVVNGRVYMATTAAPVPGGGVLVALDAVNGEPLWHFNTVPGTDAGVEVAGGAWQTPLVSSDGSVTYGVGNPYQSAASAVAHPSQLLYTDSVVNLDAATGTLRWYYQGVPNDFKDYDLQASPIATQIHAVPIVIGAGKMGYVYAMDARSGSLLWKTSVGEHNGHDEESVLALEHMSDLRTPFTLLPGAYGGVLANMALAGTTLYVVVCNQPYTITNLDQVVGLSVESNSNHPAGEVEALDVATGKVEWDTKVPELPLGAATVSNDLLFTTLYNGVLVALNRNTGAIVYSHRLPTSTNAPIAVAGDTVLIPAGGPFLGVKGHDPQLVAYTAP